VATTISSLQFDPDLHQPSFDEWSLGYRRQFPGQMAIDVAGIVKVNHDQYAQVDINGVYPAGPNQPFGGFGKVNPIRPVVPTHNNTWSTTHYRALQATLTKNLTSGFQMLFTVQRQWQHLEGTWNPSDPAQFIQPDAFPNNKNIWRTDGVRTRTACHGKLAGQQPDVESVLDPYGGDVARTVEPGGVGKLHGRGGKLDRTGHRSAPANSPLLAVFGPSTVVSSTGVRRRIPGHAHPVRLSDARRRSAQAPDVHIVGVKLGRRVSLGGDRNVELSFDVFNLLNAGHYTEFSRQGANRKYNRRRSGPTPTPDAAGGDVRGCDAVLASCGKFPTPNSQGALRRFLGVGSWRLELMSPSE